MKNRLLHSVFLIALVGLLIYSRALGNAFCWDDEVLILGNPLLRSWSNLPEIFSHGIWSGSGSYYRPLSVLSFLIDYQFWGLNPAMFHLTNIWMHILTSIGLYLVLRHHFSERASLLSALLYCVHPAISTNVFAVFGRNGVMEGILLFALLGVQRVNQRSTWGIFTAFFFILGLLSKESALTFPAVATLYAWSFNQLKSPRTKKLLASLWGVALGYIVLRLFYLPFRDLHPLSLIADQSYDVRAWTAIGALLRYILLVLFPIHTYMEKHFVYGFTDLMPWASLVLLSGLTYFAIRARKRNPIYLFGLLWFLGTIFPVSNLVVPMPYSMQDTLLYIPMIGFFWILADILNRRPNAQYIVLLAITLFSVRTLARGADWKDGFTIYTAELEHAKNSFVLNTNLGVEYYRRGDLKAAKSLFERALEIRPTYSTALNNLGAIQEGEGDLQSAEMNYRKSIQTGDYVLAYKNLATVLLKQGRKDEARQVLLDGQARFPFDEAIRQMLGQL